MIESNKLKFIVSSFVYLGFSSVKFKTVILNLMTVYFVFLFSSLRYSSTQQYNRTSNEEQEKSFASNRYSFSVGNWKIWRCRGIKTPEIWEGREGGQLHYKLYCMNFLGHIILKAI